MNEKEYAEYLYYKILEVCIEKKIETKKCLKELKILIDNYLLDKILDNENEINETNNEINIGDEFVVIKHEAEK